MTIAASSNRNDYIGTGTTDTYDFTFVVKNASHIKVIETVIATGVETVLTPGFEYTITGVGNPNGGSITLTAGDLPDTKTLTILGQPPITQSANIKNNKVYYPEVYEALLDSLTRQMQMLKEEINRCVKVSEGVSPSDFDAIIDGTPALSPDTVLGFNEDGTRVVPKTLAEIGAGGDTGPSLPEGGLAASVIEKISDTEGDAGWTDPIVYDGISQLTGAQFTASGIKETLDKIIRITYTPPTISLSGTGSSTLRERGDPVVEPTLTAVITKRSDPVAGVTFYDGTIDPGNAIGAEITADPPVPNGGSVPQATSVTFSTNRTFRARVRDDGATGGPTNVDASVTYSFVYPYYWGPGAVGLTAANVAALTKTIMNESTDRTVSFSVTVGQVLYFAYPASYGTLSSVLDENNFETIGDWTLRTENITGLDGNAVSYNIYEFENPIGVAGSYSYRFRQ